MIPSGVRIWVCEQPIDMRRSFDGLHHAAFLALGEQFGPNTLVCFLNKRRTHLKVFWREQNSVCILYKRGDHAVFRLPSGSDGGVIQIDARQLAHLVSSVPKKNNKNPWNLSTKCFPSCRQSGIRVL